MYDGFGNTDSPLSSKYLPSIPFNHIEEIIDRYPTRGAYPDRSKETVDYFTAKVDNLVKSKCLLL